MTSKPKGPLNQRLKQLEQEVQRVRGDIKSLSKAVEDPALDDLPLIQYGQSRGETGGEISPDPDPVPGAMPAPVEPVPVETPRRPEILRTAYPEPVAAPEPVPVPATAPEEADEKEPEVDSEATRFSRPASEPVRENSRSLAGTLQSEAGRMRQPDTPGSLSGDFRFANYLSSVSMSSPRPTRHERSLQRNKAVLMVVLVVMALYVVVKLLSD